MWELIMIIQKCKLICSWKRYKSQRNANINVKWSSEFFLCLINFNNFKTLITYNILIFSIKIEQKYIFLKHYSKLHSLINIKQKWLYSKKFNISSIKHIFMIITPQKNYPAIH